MIENDDNDLRPQPERLPPGAGIEGEERKSRQLLRLLATFSWMFRGRLALTCLLTVIRMGCLTGVFICLRHVIGSLAPETGDPDLTAFCWAAGGLLSFQLVAILCQFFAEETQRWFMEGMELEILQWTVHHLILLPADYFRTHALGHFIIQIERLQLMVRATVTGAFNIGTRGAAIIGIVAGVLPQQILLGGLGLAVLAGITVLVLLRSIRLRQAAKAEMKQDVALVDSTLGMFANLRDLHNFGLTEQALQEFDASCKVLAARSLEVAKVQRRAGIWLNAVGILFLGSAAAGLMSLGVSTAVALTCFAALGGLLQPLSDLIRAVTPMQMRFARLNELFALIDDLRHAQQHSGQRALDAPLEVLRLEGVRYERAGQVILDDISLEARRGDIIGIIGRSGAGKTTLANLVLRLVEPSQGRLLLNGEDARDLDLASCWRQCSAVVQVPCQLGGTLSQEVGLAHTEATKEDLAAALTFAGIDASLHNQPLEAQGWHSDGSQQAWHTRSVQQRVEWARLAVRPARLVVLDEPTSLADAAQEQRLTRSLLEHREERITLLLSHRPATLAVCDRLLVMDQGRIVAQGSPAEIFARWLPETQGERAG